MKGKSGGQRGEGKKTEVTIHREEFKIAGRSVKGTGERKREEKRERTMINRSCRGAQRKKRKRKERGTTAKEWMNRMKDERTG